MANEITTLIRCLCALNGMTGPWTYQAGDSSIKPGHIVQEDDPDEVKICAASTAPIGVADCWSYQDISTAYVAGVDVPVWLRGCGVEIYVAHDNDTGAETLDRGTLVAIDDANAGCGRSFAYSDTAAATDSPIYIIGMMTEEVTTTSDQQVFVKIILSV